MVERGPLFSGFFGWRCSGVSQLSKQLCILKENVMSLAAGTCGTQLGWVAHGLCASLSL